MAAIEKRFVRLRADKVLTCVGSKWEASSSESNELRIFLSLADGVLIRRLSSGSRVSRPVCNCLGVTSST